MNLWLETLQLKMVLVPIWCNAVLTCQPLDPRDLDPVWESQCTGCWSQWHQIRYGAIVLAGFLLQNTRQTMLPDTKWCWPAPSLNLTAIYIQSVTGGDLTKLQHYLQKCNRKPLHLVLKPVAPNERWCNCVGQLPPPKHQTDNVARHQMVPAGSSVKHDYNFPSVSDWWWY